MRDFAINNTTPVEVKPHQELKVENTNVQPTSLSTTEGRAGIIGELNQAADQRRFNLTASFVPAKLAAVEDTGRAQTAPTPQEAAARLKGDYPTADSERIRANDFAATVYAHLKDGDYQFVDQLYKELGPEWSARLVGDVGTYVKEGTLVGDIYNDVPDVSFDAQYWVAKGLAHADQSLSASWDQAFAAAAVKGHDLLNGPASAAGVAVILRQTGTDTTYLSNQFLNQVLKGNGGNNATSSQGYETDRYIYARAAGEVMAGNPQLAHEYLGKDGLLTDAERSQFIKNGVYLGQRGFTGDGFEKSLAGLPPADLQNILEHNGDAVKVMLDNFTKFYNPESTALGDLLRSVSNVTDSKGNLTAEALSFWEESLSKLGDNKAAKEGAGHVFVQHAQQIVDEETGHGSLPNKVGNPEFLKTFFAKVLFAPGSDQLRYDPGRGLNIPIDTSSPLFDAIQNQLSGVRQTLLDRANTADKLPNANDRDRGITFAADEFAKLAGTLGDGVIEAAQTYKDEFEKNAAFREKVAGFILNIVGKGAEKLGVPSLATETVSGAILDVVKSIGSGDKDAQLAAYQGLYDAIDNAAQDQIHVYSEEKHLSGDFFREYQNALTLYIEKQSERAKIH